MSGAKTVSSGWYPYDETVQPTFAVASELKMPLLFHRGIFIDGRSSRCCRGLPLRPQLRPAAGSHTEAMPLAMMEAIASGLPVAPTRVGGAPDMVEHGQTGWLVASGDFQDIASRCDSLLGDDALHRRMGERARARAVQRMEFDESVAGVVALLQRLGTPAAINPRAGNGRAAAIPERMAPDPQPHGSSLSRAGRRHTQPASASARLAPSSVALPCPPRSVSACFC